MAAIATNRHGLRRCRVNSLLIVCVLLASTTAGQSSIGLESKSADSNSAHAPLATGLFRWRVSPPLLAVDLKRLPPSPGQEWLAIKDPSIVRCEGQWHLFCTLRKESEGDGRIRIGYLTFKEWSDAPNADWNVLNLTMGYHGAPQIFYFEPHRKWYLVYQAEDENRGLKYGPCFSTNDDIANPAGWTLPEPLFVVRQGAKAGLDYWVICDDETAHLFFTTLDGRMWRAETSLANFPNGGWSDPKVVLSADIFEASHTYRLKGRNQYFTIVEAQANKRRYFKAYVADRLDGEWMPLAASREKPLVSTSNVANQDESWATSYSHGEFIRTGFNQKLEIDPEHLQLLFQGADDKEYQRGNYGQIPWRLGILTPARSR